MSTDSLKLSNWDECREHCVTGNGTLLDWFLYNNEPVGEEGEMFRDELSNLLIQYHRLLLRSQEIINDAIMHGMPITKEVASVRNEIGSLEQEVRFSPAVGE